MCMKCVNTHAQKHSIKFLKDAADEVMNQYRNTLDKINGARDKTEYNIDRIKTLMTRAEGNTQKIEGIVR